MSLGTKGAQERGEFGNEGSLGMREVWERGESGNEMSLGTKGAQERGEFGNEGSLGMREVWERGESGNEGSLGTRGAWEQGEPRNEGSLETRGARYLGIRLYVCPCRNDNHELLANHEAAVTGRCAYILFLGVGASVDPANVGVEVAEEV